MDRQPTEQEVLQKHCDVRVVAVIGVPPPSVTGTVTALVRPNVGMTTECLPFPPATTTITSSGLSDMGTLAWLFNPVKRFG